MDDTPNTSGARRIVAYDALRIFAIVSVVGIHTLMPYRGVVSPTAPVSIIDDLLHYAVPLFVFISGLFVWGRVTPKGSFGTFFAKRASVIAVPFAVWSAVYLCLLFAVGDGPETFRRALGLLVTGHTWYHLYFIPMLLTFYLLAPVASRIARFSPELLLLGCYVLRILWGPSIAVFARGLGGDLAWSYATHILTHLPHMALGAWFAIRNPRVARWWIAFALLAVGTAVLSAASLGATADLPLLARRLVYPAGMALTVLGLVSAALVFEPTLERFETLIVRGAALAFGVYFVHPLFLLGVDRAVAAGASRSLWFQPWFPVTVFLSVTAASFAVSALASRLPVACRLVGVSTPLPPLQRQRTR